jgi:ribose 5-phosphate isomerase B
MQIYLASDHAGFELKENIKKFLTDLGYEIKDFGAHKLDDNDDYPDFIRQAAEAVAKCEEGSPSTGSGRKCSAIIFGGSGEGEAMVANRIKGVRAAVIYKFDKDIIKLSREHNDANVLSIGARFVKEKDALEAIKIWLETDFTNEERHVRRIAKIDKGG